MTRYRRVVTAAIVVLACGAGQAAAAAQQSPNVLFIAVDDLNDWIGCLGGHPQTQTPNLDRLAGRGVALHRAPIARRRPATRRGPPAVRHPPVHLGRLSQLAAVAAACPTRSRCRSTSWPRGYEVRGGGKIFHGGFEDPASWHEYFDAARRRRCRRSPATESAQPRHFDWGPSTRRTSEMGDYRMVTLGRSSTCRQEHDKPFFLAVGIPPAPALVRAAEVLRQVPGRRDRAADGQGGRPGRRAAGRRAGWPGPKATTPRCSSHRQWEEAVQGYLASITFADGQIGRLLDALDDEPRTRQHDHRASGPTTAGTWARSSTGASSRSGKRPTRCR